MSSIFDKLYLTRFAEADRAARKALWGVLSQDFFQRFISEEDTVVDIGAGLCEFINAVKAGKKIAIDILYVSQFADKDVQILGNIDEVPRDSADVVFMSNFLEHLSSIEELMEVLSKVKAVLKKNGKFIIMGPNMRFAYKEYWTFADHRLPLTDSSLAEALLTLEFKLTKVVAKFLPFSTKSRYPQWSWIVKLYLKMPFAWRLFGKQYLILCEK